MSLHTLCVLIAPLIVAGLLHGCGGGSGAAASNTVPLSGQAIKGPLADAQVCAYTMNMPRALIACTRTDAIGNYRLDLPDIVREVLLETTDGTYVDEATGTTLPLSGPMRSAARVDGVAANALVTPFTELAIQLAERSSGAGPFTLAGFREQVEILEGALGYDGIATGRPFGGTTTDDSTHKNALIAFAKLQSSAAASIGDTIKSLGDTIRSCGAIGLGAQLAVFGAAAIVRNDEWYSGVIFTEGINLAASGLLVDLNGCLQPTVPGVGFSGISVVLHVSTGTGGRVGLTPVSCPSDKLTFSMGSNGAAYFTRRDVLLPRAPGSGDTPIGCAV